MVDLAFLLSASTAVIAAVASVIAAAAMIAVVIVVAVGDRIHIAVGRTENRAEATAGFRLCGGRENIQRESDIFKVSTGIAGTCQRGAGFRQTSSQGVYYDIYCAEQLYDGKQPDSDIDGDGRTQCGVCAAGMIAAAGITAAAAGTARRIPQFCRQSDRFAFCNGKRSAVGVAAANELVCSGCDVCFCRGIHLCKTEETRRNQGIL